MTKISSKWTRYNKRLFPLFSLCFLTLFLAVGLFVAPPGEAQVMFVVLPLAMMAFMYLLFKKLVWDLADEVFDCGDALLVRDGEKEERITLANVINVNVSSFTNPPRITLRLDKPSRLFGNEVAFSPKIPFNITLFAKNEIAESLIARADKARKERAI